MSTIQVPIAESLEDFRRQTALVVHMRELLSDPVMLLALELLKNSNPPVDAEPADEAIVSARLLSQMAGYAKYHTEFIKLAIPMPAPAKPLTAEFKPEP